MIAWCENMEETPLISQNNLEQEEIILLIGPEGDFTFKEVEMAKDKGFQEVRLGNKILRTETAAIYGTTAISMIKTK